MKKAMGWNFCSDALGTKIMAEIVQRVREGKVKPVIGEIADFNDLPAAITRLRDRETYGRVLIVLD